MTKFKCGDYVKHPDHGTGKILSMSTKTNQYIVEFEFETWVCQMKDLKLW